jgi:hypothetical protein
MGEGQDSRKVRWMCKREDKDVISSVQLREWGTHFDSLLPSANNCLAFNVSGVEESAANVFSKVVLLPNQLLLLHQTIDVPLFTSNNPFNTFLIKQLQFHLCSHSFSKCTFRKLSRFPLKVYVIWSFISTWRS